MVNPEDPISQLSFSDGEEESASTQAGAADAEHNDVIAGAAASTSGDTTTASTSYTGCAGVDAVVTAAEDPEDAVAMAPHTVDAMGDTVAGTQGGGKIHTGG